MPHSEDLQSCRWWAFGFPGGTEDGHDAHGAFGLGTYGSVSLRPETEPGVDTGFSGAGLWSPDYQAVVGLITKAGQGNALKGFGRGLTLYRIDEQIPDMKLSLLTRWTLEELDTSVLAEWGWTLRSDPEGGRHWLELGQGGGSGHGYRFRGRSAALSHVVDWLDRPAPDGRVLVVTGAPGAGKSALLGRVVATADATVARSLLGDDTAVRATIGSVSCAVHVEGKTALDVVAEIARAAGVAPPSDPTQILDVFGQRLTGPRFNLVVDGLDEAVDPEQARILLRDVFVPLAARYAANEFQVVVGTRSGNAPADLLDSLAGSIEELDLDSPEYRRDADLVGYTRDVLRLTSMEQAGNPYQQTEVADDLAREIASLSSGSYVIARLLAETWALRDDQGVDQGLGLADDLDRTLDAYLGGPSPVEMETARMALTVLAYAEPPGLPLPLWCAGMEALGSSVSEEQLMALARTRAVGRLIQIIDRPSGHEFRLFHQEIKNLLRHARRKVRESIHDEARLVEAWMRFGREAGWQRMPAYLRFVLPTHAQRAGVVDVMLADDGYLLHADLSRMLAVSDEAALPAGRARSRMLHSVPQALRAGPAERAAMFSVVEELDRLGAEVRTPKEAPYRGWWAKIRSRRERTVLSGHDGPVLALCTVRIGGQVMLASAGADGTIRLWNPITGEAGAVWHCEIEAPNSLCAIMDADRVVLAAAGEDSAIELIDLVGGTSRKLQGHTDWISCLAPTVDRTGRPGLLSGGQDQTVREWSLDREHPRILAEQPQRQDRLEWVTAVDMMSSPTADLIVVAWFGGRVELLDRRSGGRVLTADAGSDWVTAVARISVDGRPTIALACYDGNVRLCDPTTGAIIGTMSGATGPVTALCRLQAVGAQLLASAGEDGVIRVSQPGEATQSRVLTGHTGPTRALCPVPVGNNGWLLASGSDDGTVRLWDPTSGEGVGANVEPLGPVATLCLVPTETGMAMASTGDGTAVRVWELETGATQAVLDRHRATIVAACTTGTPSRPMLATADADGVVSVWSLTSMQREAALEPATAYGTVLCSLTLGDRPAAAVASDLTIRLWDPATSRGIRSLQSTELLAAFRALCAVPIDGRELLASADDQGTVQLWNPLTGRRVWTVKGHSQASTALCTVGSEAGFFIASGSADHTIRLLEPRTGRSVHELNGHTDVVTGLCTVIWRGRLMLASTSEDRTVRLWDPGTGMPVLTIPVHRSALSCAFSAGTLMVGLDTGLLALTLS